jgi:hypothetical protein
MKVTVCVPVWNGAAFVRETLDSVRAQTLADFRVLVSIDRSDDDSAAVCREFEKDPRFTVTTQPQRLGWIENTNSLLRHVATPFGCILPHDDLLASEYLSRLVTRLEDQDSAVLAYSDLQNFGRYERTLVQPELVGEPLHRIVTFLREHTAAVGFRGVFRTEVVKKGHYLPQDAKADTSWLLALAAEGDLVRVPDVLYHKRLHDESERMQRDQLPQAKVATWVDHCAVCYHIAMESQNWTVPERQIIAAAALDRATGISGTAASRRQWATESRALIAIASHYSLRVEGKIPAGTPPLDDNLLPPPFQRTSYDAPAHGQAAADRQGNRGESPWGRSDRSDVRSKPRSRRRPSEGAEIACGRRS